MGNRNASGAVRGYYSSAVTEEKCTHDALPIAVGHRRLRNFLAQRKGECRGPWARRKGSGSLRSLHLTRETFTEMRM